MKKIAIILFSLLITLQFVKAQEEIKTMVKEIKQEVESEGYFWVHTVELNSMLAAIGQQTTQLTFYYFAWQANPEDDPYEMDARLVKLEVKYNIAASVDYTQEYIFDEEEKLMYYMYKEEDYYEPDNSQTLYYYFDNGGLVLLERLMVEKTKGKKNEILGFDDEEAERVDIINSKAITYLEVFNDLLDVEQLK